MFQTFHKCGSCKSQKKICFSKCSMKGIVAEITNAVVLKMPHQGDFYKSTKTIRMSHEWNFCNTTKPKILQMFHKGNPCKSSKSVQISSDPLRINSDHFRNAHISLDQLRISISMRNQVKSAQDRAQISSNQLKSAQDRVQISLDRFKFALKSN